MTVTVNLSLGSSIEKNEFLSLSQKPAFLKNYYFYQNQAKTYALKRYPP